MSRPRGIGAKFSYKIGWVVCRQEVNVRAVLRKDWLLKYRIWIYGLIKLQKSVRQVAKRNWVADAAVPRCSSRMICTHTHFQIQDSVFIFKQQWVPRHFPPAVIDPLDEPGMASMGLKHWGGKFPINKIHSLLSYLLWAAACKGVPQRSFCRALDSLHCMCELVLCALNLKLLVHNFRQSAEAPEAAATSTLCSFAARREQTHQRLVRILFAKSSYLHKEKMCVGGCVPVCVQRGVYKGTHILTVLQDNLTLSENAA